MERTTKFVQIAAATVGNPESGLDPLLYALDEEGAVWEWNERIGARGAWRILPDTDEA